MAEKCIALISFISINSSLKNCSCNHNVKKNEYFARTRPFLTVFEGHLQSQGVRNSFKFSRKSDRLSKQASKSRVYRLTKMDNSGNSKDGQKSSSKIYKFFICELICQKSTKVICSYAQQQFTYEFQRNIFNF